MKIVKKILIVGENSYIGVSFARYASERYDITIVGAKDGKWKACDFSAFDVVLHCAGIAHIPQKKNMRNLYYSVNCDLAVDVANTAKAAGVKQFIFLSSMAVYGNMRGEITPETPPGATDFYGGSKVLAEQKLIELQSINICIVRPPMVYGYGCKGNFPRLVKLADKLPIFPKVQNKRSMIYIDNLCEFLCKVIEDNKNGIHLPQNAEYVNTTELVQTIAIVAGKRMRTTSVFNPLIFLLKKFIPSLDKLFGDLVYAKTGDEIEYNVVEFKEGVGLSCFCEKMP